MTPKWTIPADGKVLRAAHLRGQTLFTLAEAGRGRLGEWGFFRPRGAEEGEEFNVFELEGRMLVVHNLAVIAREGVVIQHKGKLSAGAAFPWREIRMSWDLPGRENDPSEVRLVVGDAPTDPRPDIVVEVGEITDDGAMLTAPALTLDCSPALADSWRAVEKALEGLAKAVEGGGRVSRFARALTAGALRRVASPPPGSDPGGAVRELEAAAGTLAAFIEDGGPEAAREEADRLCEAAAEACRGAGESHEALRRALEEVRSAAERTPAMRDWLAGSAMKRKPIIEWEREGGAYYSGTCLLKDDPPGDLLVTVDRDLTEVQYKFGEEEDWTTERVVEGKVVIPDSERGGRTKFFLRAPSDSAPKVQIPLRNGGEGA